MFVIDGFSKEIITDITYHELDIDFFLIRRHTYNVVGITVRTARFRLLCVETDLSFSGHITVLHTSQASILRPLFRDSPGKLAPER